jgi:adenylyltransferase/sulfurtransferase
MLTIPEALLQQCFEHGRQTYPEEACGYLSSGSAAPDTLLEVHPIPNIQNRMHAEDPVTYPRQAHEAYFLDPKVRLPLERRLRGEGREVRVIFHTHPDVGAYFSEEDRRKAVWNGEPLFPGVVYLVCGIKAGAPGGAVPDGAVLAWWDAAAKDFRVEPVRSA